MNNIVEKQSNKRFQTLKRMKLFFKPIILGAKGSFFNQENKLKSFREQAAIELGDSGDRSVGVIEALLKGLEDRSANVREESANALAKLCVKEERVESALFKLLSERSSVAAASALGVLECKDEKTIQLLIETIKM